ncbi:MAG: hypothetical protein WKG07_23165 [Hymenobacter sp.]
MFGLVLIPGLYVLFASFEKVKNLEANAEEEGELEPVEAIMAEPELVA